MCNCSIRCRRLAALAACHWNCANSAGTRRPAYGVGSTLSTGQPKRLSWAMAGTSYQDHGGRHRRKSSRRVFTYPAQLEFGRGVPPAPCVIVDISELGAQVEVSPGTDFPDEFSLLIGGHASVRRQCRIVWRSTSRIGVRFHGAPERVPRQELAGQIVLRPHLMNGTMQKKA